MASGASDPSPPEVSDPAQPQQGAQGHWTPEDKNQR